MPSAGGRGGQGRPVRAARRGSLEGPGGSVVASHYGIGPPGGRSWLPLVGWTQRTSPLLNVLSGVTEVLGDRPFLRDGVRMVCSGHSQNGLTQIDGHATRGATAILELASWLCPSLLKRPPGTGSGSRHLAARSRPA